MQAFIVLGQDEISRLENGENVKLETTIYAGLAEAMQATSTREESAPGGTPYVAFELVHQDEPGY